MFANVLIKFFTRPSEYENKAATQRVKQDVAMIDALHTALTRRPASLAQDFAGAAAILVILVVGLNLPALS